MTIISHFEGFRPKSGSCIQRYSLATSLGVPKLLLHRCLFGAKEYARLFSNLFLGRAVS